MEEILINEGVPGVRNEHLPKGTQALKATVSYVGQDKIIRTEKCGGHNHVPVMWSASDT